MKKFLFYLCGGRNKASSRVRGYWIAEELEERDVKTSLECRSSKSALVGFALKTLFHDVVIFQKTYSRWHVLLERWASSWGKTTILDLDDAPSRNNNPTTLGNVERMMRNVSAVTVGSKALKEYAEQFSNNVHLIPSSIRLKYYQPQEQFSHEKAQDPQDLSTKLSPSTINNHSSTALSPSTNNDHSSTASQRSTKNQALGTECGARAVTLGWIGNGAHYKRDLIEILKEPLTEVAKEYPIRFKLIGACGEQELCDAFSNIQGLEIDFIDQVEWSNPTAVADALQDIDIGLYPLLPNKFNQYKCGFKALEYMAMKIPVISSDVAENREIIEEGVNGAFASSSKDWKTSIMTLIVNAGLRDQMGRAGRALVEERYSVKKATELLTSVWC